MSRNDAERLADLEAQDPTLTPLLVAVVAQWLRTPPADEEAGQ